MCLFACLLYRRPTISGPNSHPLPRCGRHRKSSMSGRFRTPMVSVLTGERPSTSRMLLGGSPEAWPMAHGHSQVRHPGQSRLPGPMVVAGTIFQQIAMCIVAPPPFLSIFPSSVHCLAFFRRMHSRSHSGAPIHLPAVLRWCPWGLAHSARPLPRAASRLLWPPGPNSVSATAFCLFLRPCIVLPSPSI